MEWHKKQLSNREKYTSNEVGKVIRLIVENSDNWKGAPRGNPRRAYQAMRETQARQNGWTPPDENEGREEY